MSLTERINREADRRQTEVTPIVERRQPEREPAWLRRMREQGLPNVDHTADIRGRAA